MSESSEPCESESRDSTGSSSPYADLRYLVKAIFGWAKRESSTRTCPSVQLSSTIPRLPFIRSSSSGDLKWKFQTGARVQTQGALGPDGTAYFGSGDGKVYALRVSDGSLQVCHLPVPQLFSAHALPSCFGQSIPPKRHGSAYCRSQRTYSSRPMLLFTIDDGTHHPVYWS